MKNSTYINVEFIVYEFVSMEHGTQIVIARHIAYVCGPSNILKDVIHVRGKVGIHE